MPSVSAMAYSGVPVTSKLRTTGVARFLIGYILAVLVLASVDVAVMVLRFRGQNDLTPFELLLLPLSGLRLSWPVHVSTALAGAAWLMFLANIRLGRTTRAMVLTVPLACVFAVALHFSVRLPFFRGISSTALLSGIPLLGLALLPITAAGMDRLSRGAGVGRRALLALPIVLGLGAFGAAACITFAVVVRVPATLSVVTILAALSAWLLPPRLEQPSFRWARLTAAVLVMGLGAITTISVANEDRRIRSDAAVAYRTYVMQALLFTKLAAFKPVLPQPTCHENSAPQVAPHPEPTGLRRNILLLTVDAARADHLALHGYDRVTMPHVEELARESVVFETAYSPAPATQASNIALWTGIGIPTLREAKVWPPTLHTLARGQGYATFATRLRQDVGVSVPGLREPNSFDQSVPMGDRAPQLVSDLLRFIDDAEDRPWVATAHFIEPHDTEMYSTVPRVFAERRWSRYDDALHFVDAHIGLLLDGLRKRQQLDNTVVIVSADHGEFFGEHGRLYHGSLLYEPVMRVPLIVYVPGRDPSRIPWPASGFDIAPTALRAATGQKWPLRILGRDLLGLVDGVQGERRAVFMENVSGVSGVRRHVAVRDGRWKYLGFLGTDVEQLFDIETDPGEVRNLAGKLTDVRNKMRDVLHGVLSERACVRDALVRHAGTPTDRPNPRDVTVGHTP